MTPPTLVTQRLILRAPVFDDFADHAAFWASDRSVHMGGPLARNAAWGWFCNDLAQWALFGHGALMLTLQQGGPAIGQVAVMHGPLFPEPELGWFIYPAHEGKGYVTEAAAALRDWAFGTRGLTTLVSYVDPPNHRSARVAERLGAVLDPDAATPGNDPNLVYRHPRVTP